MSLIRRFLSVSVFRLSVYKTSGPPQLTLHPNWNNIRTPAAMATFIFTMRVLALFFLYARLTDAKVEIISKDVDLKVGSEQLLLCKAGKDADISWLKDGEDIDMDRHVLEKIDETTSYLTLKKVDLRDSGVYTCKCEYGTHDDEASTTIFVYEGPDFGTTKTYHEFLVNQTARVPCVVTGKPDVEITWMRNGHPVSNDGKSHLTVMPDKNLQITNIRKDDHGTYSCVANIKGRQSISKHLEISVVVNVPPTVVLRRERVNVKAGPNASLTIDCLVQGFPKPNITWTTPSTSDSSRYIYNSDKSQLSIPAVVRSDFGEYVCAATNKIGEANTSIILDVSEHPVVTLSQDEMVVNPGGSLFVSCNATGHPPPRVQWVTHENKKVEGSNTNLTIDNVKPSDGGVYSCIASGAGTTTKDFRLITSPEMPIYFTVTPGPTSAHIIPHNVLINGGSPITSYVVQWRKQLQDEWSQTVIPYSDPLVVKNLAPYTEYSVRFAAKNEHLVGGLSAEKKIRTQAKQGEPDSPVLSPTDGKIEENSYSIPIKQLNDGGHPIQHFLVRYRMDKEGENWREKEMPANSSKIVLQNLQSNSDYQLEVFAVNANGSSRPSILKVSTPQAVVKPSLGKGGVAGIVIVIFLVLLVAVDAFCCYTNHCGLLNFLSRKLFGHKISESKSMEEGVINNAAVDMNGLEKPRGSIPKPQAQNGATNGVSSEVTCDKAPLTKFEKPPANGDSSNDVRL